MLLDCLLFEVTSATSRLSSFRFTEDLFSINLPLSEVSGFVARRLTVGFLVVTVGLEVGSSVGVLVGSSLIVGYGDMVGFADNVGKNVGVKVMVGSWLFVGTSDGDGEGLMEGKCEGFTVGKFDGSVVGNVDGRTDGSYVG